MPPAWFVYEELLMRFYTGAQKLALSPMATFGRGRDEAVHPWQLPLVLRRQHLDAGGRAEERGYAELSAYRARDDVRNVEGRTEKRQQQAAKETESF
jgi:hypothetical protein